MTMIDPSRAGVTGPTFPQARSGRLWWTACLLLAVTQLGWAGYQLGVGNQGIQVAFLQSLSDSRLFANDDMVRQTLGHYPSLFFSVLAPVARIWEIPQLYLGLHLAVTAATLITLAGLTRSTYDDDLPAFLVVLMVLAGHMQALAGEVLYSTGLTHTWAAFPLGLAALWCFMRQRYILAAALVGLLLNFHALEAAYLAGMMGFWALFSLRELGWKRAVGCLLALGIAGGPGLVLLARKAGVFDDTWLRLMYVRSADHSFPSAWWQNGATDLPRFALLLGLAVVALGFRATSGRQRKLVLMGAAVLLMFVVGYVFTEIVPVPLVIRAQLFRSSRFLEVLCLLVLAHGCARGLRMLRGRAPGVARWRGILEAVLAVATVVVLALPSATALWPWLLLLALGVALINGRLGWHQALLGGAMLLVAIIAWRTIDFVVPGLTAAYRWEEILPDHLPTRLGWGCVLAGTLTWLGTVYFQRRWLRWLIGGVALALGLGAMAHLYPGLLATIPADADWVDVQTFARQRTPVNAVFLTPAQMSGFRIHSARAVVGEMRDGTQLYFAPGYTSSWWERMQALQPGMLLAPDGRRLFSRGKSLGQLEDEQIIQIARRYRADYVVLPLNPERSLQRIYANKTWGVYQPVIPPPASQISGVTATDDARFYREVVLPNIEKYRKSDASLQVLDASGRPILGAKYRLTQLDSPFNFAASLPFFKEPAVRPRMDFKPPPVDPRELDRFSEIFNASMIPFSGKWMYLEPEPGKRVYDDLDAYVDWCVAHGIRLEFHFLSGYPPTWLKAKSPKEQADLFLAHAQELVRRYGDKIAAWQVVNEKISIDRSPAVFAELRKLVPQAKLGIADCARFYSTQPSPERERDLLRGIEEIRWLKKQGVKVDFFGFHGHRPFGLWADSRVIYETFDAFAREGVKIHVSEFGIPLDTRIEGSVRQGRWTPELQAEYYERFFTICFSHPEVESVNLFGMGPVTWMRGAGLLDAKYEPKPAFQALKNLVTQRFRTRMDGTLGLTGMLNFRGFHGRYEMVVILPDGKTCNYAFTLQPGTSLRQRLRLDPAQGTLTPWP